MPSVEPYFESVPVDGACGYCSGRLAVQPLPAPIDAVYCISVQEQPHRTAAAVAHFHSVGLCRHVTLYRPMRGVNGSRAIWNSHRTLARHALAHGCRSALMLEDDVYFRAPWGRLAPRVTRAFAALPADWHGLYLGHVPVQAYFVRANLMRVRSGCTHAYIASARLIKWLADRTPTDTEVVPWRVIGLSIDGAFANLPGMYALFPMVARQRFLGDFRIDARLDRAGRHRSWRDADRWRHHFLFRGAYVAEAVAVALSPLHRLTLERSRQKSQARLGEPAWPIRAAGLFDDAYYGQKSRARLGEPARLIRAAGLFDDAYYEKMRPDVAAHGPINPLWHYLLYGATEGAWPHPLFDPAYYAAQALDLGTENPLLHFIRIGAERGYKPHPLFDTAFYKSRYAQTIPAGINALSHFLTAGGMAGLSPHPLLDSAWYLARHPDLRERRENPLLHYLEAGWRAGAAPHPQFDGELYLRQNPDVRAAGVNPLEHFVRHGQAEGRVQPTPEQHCQH